MKKFLSIILAMLIVFFCFIAVKEYLKSNNKNYINREQSKLPFKKESIPDKFLVSITSSIIAVMSLLLAYRSFQSQQLREDLSSFKDYVYGQYVNRHFNGNNYCELKDEKIETLRQAKNYAAKRYYDAGNHVWKEEWQKESDFNKKGTWQNAVAFETAGALQVVGIGCFYGALSLDMTLADLADSFVDDWPLCWYWLETYRKDESVKTLARKNNVDYHRRHGEWLSLVS